MTLHFNRLPQASIIAVMVNWNGKAYLQASLLSVLTELAKHKGELLLVDNASTDGSEEFVQQQFPEVVILQTGENLGGAGGFSAGMRTALQCKECEYIWLLDNDIVAEENALSPLMDCLNSHATAGAAGSQICLYDKPETVQEVGAQLTPWLAGLKQCFSGQERLPADTGAFTVDYLAACSILIKRSCLEQVGVFGDFFIFYDDVEWGLRAKRAGWSLWGVPASVIRHQFSATKPVVPWREYYRKRNRLALLAMYPPHKGGLIASCIYLVYLNYIVYAHKWRGYKSLYQAYLCARQDALRGRLGKRDLTSLNESIGALPVECLGEVNEVLIDIGEGAGDAVALMNAVRQCNPAAVFYLPGHLARYLRFIDMPGVALAARRNYPMLIVGREYKLRSLVRSPCVYSYGKDRFIRLSPLDLVNDLAVKTAALLVSALLAPLHWLVVLWRFRGKRFLWLV